VYITGEPFTMVHVTDVYILVSASTGFPKISLQSGLGLGLVRFNVPLDT